MTAILRTVPAIDTTTARDVTDSITTAIDADPAVTREALRRVDLTAPLMRALHALDATDRFALAPTRLRSLRYGLIWRIDGARPAERVDPGSFDAFSSPGHVKVRWELGVEPAAGAGAYVSIRTRFAATDEPSRERLLDARAIIGPLSATLVQRAARAVKALAESDHVEGELAA